MGGTNHQKSLWAAELWPELLLVDPVKKSV